MRFHRIRSELERDGIGEHFWEFLMEVCGRVGRRYPPATYNDGLPWTDDALAELAQEVAVERLLPNDQEQLVYVVERARDLDELGRMLSFQVRRTLSRRRGVTVSDRLLRRIRSLSEAGSFEVRTTGGVEWVAGSSGKEGALLSERELHQAVALVAGIARLPALPSATRESMVYAPATLSELVGRLLGRFEVLAMEDIRRILESLLTPWLPTLLRDIEEDFASGGSPESEAQRREMERQLIELADRLDDVQATILLGKSAGSPDSDLAASLGRSRPWVADRKTEVFAEVERVMDGVPGEWRSEGLLILLDRLAQRSEQI